MAHMARDHIIKYIIIYYILRFFSILNGTAFTYIICKCTAVCGSWSSPFSSSCTQLVPILKCVHNIGSHMGAAA